MELTTHLVQESRPTRLLVNAPYAVGLRATDGVLTLYDLAFTDKVKPESLGWMHNFRLQPERPYRIDGLQFELIPLHSPLLRESLLVSFPPLNNMLKFRGFSYFIWDHKFKSWNLHSFVLEEGKLCSWISMLWLCLIGESRCFDVRIVRKQIREISFFSIEYSYFQLLFNTAYTLYFLNILMYISSVACTCEALQLFILEELIPLSVMQWLNDCYVPMHVL